MEIKYYIKKYIKCTQLNANFLVYLLIFIKHTYKVKQGESVHNFIKQHTK